jgi:hypothetical protein
VDGKVRSDRIGGLYPRIQTAILTDANVVPFRVAPQNAFVDLAWTQIGNQFDATS